MVALCVALAGVPASVSAAVVEGLYEATVPVADQSAAARREAEREALSAVLVRATGRRDAVALPGLAGLLDSASRLVQQYRYESRESGLYFAARFDPAGVQRALFERGIAAWGRERPAVLAWLAYDDGFERALVDDEAPLAIREAFGVAAQARGLPTIAPLMDLQDRGALSFADLWGGFEDSIQQASRRYASDAVLVGRLYAVDAERWGARWILYSGDEVTHAESHPGALEEVTAFGVHWVADLFADRYALMPEVAQDGRTRVVVAGIGDVAAYARVTRYLESLSPVVAVAVERVDGDEVTFALELRASAAQLERAIALGSRLARTPDEYGEVLRYTVRP